MVERPPMVEGGVLRSGVRIRSEIRRGVEMRASVLPLLDDWQAEIADDLPVGLMFDASDTDVFESGSFVGVDRVLTIVKAF